MSKTEAKLLAQLREGRPVFVTRITYQALRPSQDFPVKKPKGTRNYRAAEALVEKGLARITDKYDDPILQSSVTLGYFETHHNLRIILAEGVTHVSSAQ
jgi:hypothetical protein